MNWGVACGCGNIVPETISKKLRPMHIAGQNCIESMEAALQYGRHHHGKSKQRKASQLASTTVTTPFPNDFPMKNH